MYNNLIYFILVLLVFSTYQPVDEPILPWWAGLMAIGAVFFFFWGLARARFDRLRRELLTETNRLSPGQSYTNLTTRLSILALLLFTVNVYFLGLKQWIAALPLIGSSSTLVELGGLIGFALYLALVWSEAFKAYALSLIHI